MEEQLHQLRIARTHGGIVSIAGRHRPPQTLTSVDGCRMATNEEVMKLAKKYPGLASRTDIQVWKDESNGGFYASTSDLPLIDHQAPFNSRLVAASKKKEQAHGQR